MNTLSPYVVVSNSLKVTATDVTVGHGVEVGVGAGPPLALVCPGGNTVFVAVAYGPFAEVTEHTDGTLFAEDSPHEAGTWPLRRAMAVKKAASITLLVPIP